MKEKATALATKGNLIFCDLDGVLTSVYDSTSYLLLDPTIYKPSKKKVDILKKLADKTGSKVVISSNWRKFEDDAYYSYHGIRFMNPLPKLRCMLKDYIAGELPPERHMTKAECLILWLEEHPEFKGEFVIFDDDPRENFATTTDKGINKRYIQTGYQDGLTDEDVKAAEKILMGDGKAPPPRKYKEIKSVELKW